jgi:hypothetical protein
MAQTSKTSAEKLREYFPNVFSHLSSGQSGRRKFVSALLLS